MSTIFTKLIPWAGAKWWMLNLLMRYLPMEYGDVYIPFGGRLDVLQILRANGYEKHVYASDISSRLILCHNAVKFWPEEVIALLEEHRRNISDDYYLSIRDRFHPEMPLAQAGADHILVCQNAYHGIIRMSAGGRCTNVNARDGFRFKPETVRKHSFILRNTTIVAEDYAATAMRAKPGDLVIFDPPYPDQGSVYGCLGFSAEDHYRLANVCRALHRKGVLFLMTNGDSSFIRHIYRDFCIEEIEAPRTLGRVKNEGKAKELVITNY